MKYVLQETFYNYQCEHLCDTLTFSIDVWSRLRWLGVEVCWDGKCCCVLLAGKSTKSPLPSFIRDEMISKGDWGDILVIGRMSPDLVTSNWRCFIIASSRSFSFCSCRSSWLTICSCTRVWAMVLSSKVCAELRCLCKWNWNKYT